ncbi:hypothetical protein ABXT06_15220 [Flavobacterium sp. UW10123]|uniref:hypothetical protein n=1 Tax=Flavobacterium sp. UW10123 TaxID=3230800 RepID=UPI003393B238
MVQIYRLFPIYGFKEKYLGFFYDWEENDEVKMMEDLIKKIIFATVLISQSRGVAKFLVMPFEMPPALAKNIDLAKAFLQSPEHLQLKLEATQKKLCDSATLRD